MKKNFFWSILFALILCSQSMALSQSLTITNFPQGYTATSVSPTFILQSSSVLVDENFTLSPENHKIIDTSNVLDGISFGIDSIISTYFDHVKIFVVPIEIYQAQVDSLLEQNTSPISIMKLKKPANSFQISTGPLDNDRQYVLIVDNLFGKTSGGFIFHFPTLVQEFSTQKPLFGISSANIPAIVNSCNTSFTIGFNREIDSLYLNSGNLIDVLKVDSISINNDSHVEEMTSPVFSQQDISSDGKSVLITLDNLTAGKYNVNINVNLITGSNSENYTTSFQRINYLDIDFGQDSNSILLPPYYTNKLHLIENDTLYLQAFKYLNGKQFTNWIVSPNCDWFTNDTCEFQVIPINCAMLGKISITPVYEVIQTEVVEVKKPQELVGEIKVYNLNGEFLGNEGIYEIDHADYDGLKIEYKAQPFYKLIGWASTCDGINNLTDVNYITFKGGKYDFTEIEPVVEPLSKKYVLNIQVQFANIANSRYDPTHRIEDIVNISENNMIYSGSGYQMTKKIQEDMPFTKNISVAINDIGPCDCYKIYAVVGDIMIPFEHDYCSGGPHLSSWDESIVVDDNDPVKNLIILIDRKLNIIEMEMVAQNGLQISNDKKDASICLIPDFPENTSCDHVLGRKEFYERTDLKEYVRYAVKCHQSLKIETKTDESYADFVEYTEQQGSYHGGTDNANPLLVLPNVCEDYSLINGKMIQSVIKNSLFKVTSIKLSYLQGAIEFNDWVNISKIVGPDFDYKLSGNEDPINVVKIDPVQNTSVFEIKFNKPVNFNTIINNMMSLNFQDASKRIDYIDFLNIRLNYFATSNLNNYEIVDDRTIKIFPKCIYKGNLKGVPKYGLLNVNITDYILSADGEKLSNPKSFQLLTEYPTVSAKIKRFKVLGDPDPDDMSYGAEVVNYTGYVEDDGQCVFKKFPPNSNGSYFVLSPLLSNWNDVNEYIIQKKLTTHKNQYEHRDFYIWGTVFFEHDDGNINNEVRCLRELERTANTNWGYNMATNMYQALHHHQYNTFAGIRYLSDDFMMAYPACSSGVCSIDGIRDYVFRWGTSNSENGYEIHQHSNNNIQFELLFEIK